jgi:hypothetical protein
VIPVLHELEQAEWRALGALRFIDAPTGTPVDRPLRVQGDGAEFVRNRSGLYVIRRWTALATHDASFESPPAAPAVGSLKLPITATDASGTYLPIAATVTLPRDPDPSHGDNPDSLFQPLTISVYPTTTAEVGANWAVLRVYLTETQSGDALGGALLRVRSNGNVLARGLTDWRGEALVPVVGVPATTFSEDANAVVISEIGVTLEAGFDPAVGSRTPAAAVRDRRPQAKLPVVDPVSLDTRFATLKRATLAITIAARRRQSATLTLDLT